MQESLLSTYMSLFALRVLLKVNITTWTPTVIADPGEKREI